MKNHYVLEHRRPGQTCRRRTDIVIRPLFRRHRHRIGFALIFVFIIAAMALEAHFSGITP